MDVQFVTGRTHFRTGRWTTTSASESRRQSKRLSRSEGRRADVNVFVEQGVGLVMQIALMIYVGFAAVVYARRALMASVLGSASRLLHRSLGEEHGPGRSWERFCVSRPSGLNHLSSAGPLRVPGNGADRTARVLRGCARRPR